MIGDCIDYRYENGKLIFVRQTLKDMPATPTWSFTGEGPLDRVAYGGANIPRRPSSRETCPAVKLW